MKIDWTGFNIPQNKKNVNNPYNALWVLQNIRARNTKNPLLDSVIMKINKLVLNGCSLTKISPITNKSNTMLLPTSEKKIIKWQKHKKLMPLIQDYFPELDSKEREFILTGITEECWETTFNEEKAH